MKFPVFEKKAKKIILAQSLIAGRSKFCFKNLRGLKISINNPVF